MAVLCKLIPIRVGMARRYEATLAFIPTPVRRFSAFFVEKRAANFATN
jgi:hypothetical protein